MCMGSIKVSLFQLKELAGKYPEDAASFTSAVSNAEENVAWGENNISGISSWLQVRVNSANTIRNINFVSIVLLLIIIVIQ